MTLIYNFVFAFGVFLASVAQLLMKKAANDPYPEWLKQFLRPLNIVAYGLFFSSLLINIIAFMHIPYKNGAIIDTLGYIYILILGKIFLNEKITKGKIIGNTIIILGIIIFYL